MQFSVNNYVITLVVLQSKMFIQADSHLGEIVSEVFNANPHDLMLFFYTIEFVVYIIVYSYIKIHS